MGASQQADDASGGAHTFTFLADAGFLYRLELCNLTRGETTVRNVHAITSHAWAADKSGLGSGAFDLNYRMAGAPVGGTFSVYSLMNVISSSGVPAVPEIRRFPMGRLDKVLLQVLMSVTIPTNTTGITNELSIVWTYWRKEATYRPGFLSSFFESPVVPTALKVGA